MTNEEAIETLINHTQYKCNGNDLVALYMAIEALEQESCEDAISREDTLKAMIEQLGIRNEDYLLPAEATLYKVVKNMPPVTPQPKTGHWVSLYDVEAKVGWYECDRCHTERAFNTNFCPDCGAKMIEPQERSDKE